MYIKGFNNLREKGFKRSTVLKCLHYTPFKNFHYVLYL